MEIGTVKMAQCIKAPATKAANLNSKPWTHMVEREPTSTSWPVTFTCVLWHIHTIK